MKDKIREYWRNRVAVFNYPLTPDECFPSSSDSTIKVEISLLDLYRQVYPHAEDYQVHQFFSCFALEINEEEQLARKILMDILNDEDKVVIKSNN